MVYSFFGKKPRIEDAETVDISSYLYHFLVELDKVESRKIVECGIKTVAEAERIKGLINTPSAVFGTTWALRGEHDEWQEVDYISSNLGYGFVFYFICIGCGARVRYLYRLNKLYRCKPCLRLGYPKKRPKHKNRHWSYEDPEWPLGRARGEGGVIAP